MPTDKSHDRAFGSQRVVWVPHGMWLCIVRYVRLDLLAEKSFMLTVLVRDTVHVHLTKTDKVSMECRYHRLAYTKLQLLPQPSSLWRLLCAVPSWACDTPRHRTALCCILLPHRTARHCTALHGTARHCTARHGTALHCTARHGTALHCTAGRGARGLACWRVADATEHGRCAQIARTFDHDSLRCM